MKYTAAHWGVYQHSGHTLEPYERDPNPSRIGRGWLSAATDVQTRVLKPAIRKGWLDNDRSVGRGDDEYIEVDWHDALDFTATALTNTIKRYGNESIYGGSYGWASAGRFHHAQSQLRRFLNCIGGSVQSVNTYSHAAAEVLFPQIIGMSNRALLDDMCSMPLIAEHADIVVAFGGLSKSTAQIASSGTSYHELPDFLGALKNANIELCCVSPQKTDMLNAHWMSIRPCTDTALIMAITFELVQMGGHDEAFIARYTHGWSAYWNYLSGKTDGIVKSADWAQAICDVPAADIVQLTEKLAAKKSMLMFSWSVQRAEHGEQPIWAGLALACALGHVGKPGLGFGFGYGSTAPVGRAAKLVPWPSLPQGDNPVDQFIPVARIADMLLHPGEHYRYNGENRLYPDIKLVYWAGGNPFHHHQDLLKLQRAWQKPETIIVHEHSWTATAQRADIVLPATTALERHDIMMNRRDPRLVYMSPCMEPMGEALDDFAIFCQLAERLGCNANFSEMKSDREWLQWLWTRAEQVASQHEFTLPDFDRFRDEGVFELPDFEQVRYPFKQFIDSYSKTPLKTQSGKIEIVSQSIKDMELKNCHQHPYWFEPSESLINASPEQLHLLTPQPGARLHSQNEFGSESQADKIKNKEPVLLHPATATAHNIKDGDVVLVFNERGACLAGARLTEAIRQDCVSIATGAWFSPLTTDERVVDQSGNPNILTLDVGCSELSQGTSANTTLVRIKRLGYTKSTIKAL